MRKLTKAEKILLIEACSCSSMTTPRWRGYVPLSNLGLVEIDGTYTGSWKAAFGVPFKSVKATAKGHDVAEKLYREVGLWHAIANLHSTYEWAKTHRMLKTDGAIKPCLCWACMTAVRMSPRAA